MQVAVAAKLVAAADYTVYLVTQRDHNSACK